MAATVILVLGLLFCQARSQLCSPNTFQGSSCDSGSLGPGLKQGQCCQPSGSFGLQATPCNLQTPACGTQGPSRGIQLSNCGFQSPNYGKPTCNGGQTPACGIQLSPCNIPSPPCGIQTTSCNLQIPQCLQTPSCGPQPPLCGLQTNTGGLQLSSSGLQAPPCGLQAPPCGLQAPPCGLQAPPCGLQAPPCGLQSAPFGLQSLIFSEPPSFVPNLPNCGQNKPPLNSSPCANPNTVVDNTLANTLANAIQLLILSNLLENTQSPCSNLLSPFDSYRTPCNSLYETVALEYPCNQIVSYDNPCVDTVISPYLDTCYTTTPCDTCYNFDCVNPYANGFSNPIEAVFAPVGAEVLFPSEIPAQLTCSFGYSLPNNAPCVSVNVEPLPLDAFGTCGYSNGVFF